VLRRRVAPEAERVGIDALAGDAVEALGDVEPLDLDLRRTTRLRVQHFATTAEAVRLHLVTRAAD
jgi:hypothetical protein